MHPILLSILLGLTAAAANVFGGAIIVQKNWDRSYLKYFVALGAGFMLATAIVEIFPASLELRGKSAPIACSRRLSDRPPLRTHGDAPFSLWRGNPQGRVRPRAPGIFSAHGADHSYFLRRHRDCLGLHRLQLAGMGHLSGDLPAQDSRRIHRLRRSCWPAGKAGALPGAHRSSWARRRLAGVLTMAIFRHQVSFGLPLSAGVTIYVAASDLMPEVNREPGGKMALVVFLGVGLLFLLDTLAHVHYAIPRYVSPYNLLARLPCTSRPCLSGLSLSADLHRERPLRPLICGKCRRVWDWWDGRPGCTGYGCRR